MAIFQLNLVYPIALDFLPPAVPKENLWDKWHGFITGCMFLSLNQQ